MKTVDWTDDMVARLRQLDEAGMPLSQIAMELGISRGAVAGKRHRLYVPLWKRSRAKKVPAPALAPTSLLPPREVRIGYAGGIMFALKARIKKPPAPLAPSQPNESKRKGVHLFDLKPSHCRWPVQHMYSCGKPRVRGSYCKKHSDMAYRPLNKIHVDLFNKRRMLSIYKRRKK